MFLSPCVRDIVGRHQAWGGLGGVRCKRGTLALNATTVAGRLLPYLEQEERYPFLLQSRRQLLQPAEHEAELASTSAQERRYLYSARPEGWGSIGMSTQVLWDAVTIAGTCAVRRVGQGRRVGLRRVLCMTITSATASSCYQAQCSMRRDVV